MDEYQCTIEKEVSVKGIDLNTGRRCSLTFKGAPEGTGIVFVRKDIPTHPRIPAQVDYASHKGRSTSLEKDGVRVNIVEHVMAAIAGMEIDNLIVEVDNNEPPVLDGSAKPFVDMLRRAQRRMQKTNKECFIPSRPYVVSDSAGDSYLILIPAEERKITYTFEFPDSSLGSSACSIPFKNEEDFGELIAPARTFGFLKDALALKEKGLLKGGSLENAVVIDGDKILNKELRFPDEIVRHKILDIIGDLYLSGKSLRKTHIIGMKSGHSLNIKMAENLIKGEKEMSETLDVREIKKILPHRYPFLFVDRILVLGRRRAVGLKSVTGGEDFFQGHFPDFPIMPAVLIIEAMAQVAGVLLLSKSENKGMLPFFAGIDNAKFRKPVIPGDQLIMEVEIVRLRTKTGKVHATATVGDKKVAEADFIFSLAQKDES
ncbi:MAG TPA: UDP-3-O-[3-hydroxymyristoyl] N-acetylglucosamine deacetylase [Candidatus Omnitrophica bacterium]|nr:UDP-3-O-[3-hydroxymyristoyl] N-acetylglucosamine deacetylase [Candidatus Omnitrophota bacterium]